MAQRIVVLLAVALACGYGVKQLLGGFKRKYFIVALCGMAALFFSRLYYLIIILSDGTDEVLTVGTLGQAAAYLFFMTANINFLSREIAQKAKKKICISGAIGAAVIASLFIFSAVRVGNAGAYIGELIYVFSMCGAFYISACVITYRNENTACGAVYSFNICVCILAVLNALSEFMTALTSGAGSPVIMWALTAVCSGTILLMLPLLRKGMNKWQQ